MATLVGTASVASATPPLARPEGYVLAWSDEFDEPGSPSAERWAYDTSRNRAGWYNDELQYYARNRAENARVEDGRLIISARHEDLSGARLRDWGGQAFSSARLTTRGKVKWRRGYFEIRARMPCVRGSWPAIWLLPDTHRGNWDGGEIDIAEHVGFLPDTVHHAVHTRERNFRRGNHLTTRTQIDACGAFHTYQLLWTEEDLVIGVDGRPSLTAPAAAFDRHMSLILNVAVGGTWGGQRGVDGAAFPARMEVDYVRVWQRPEGRR